MHETSNSLRREESREYKRVAVFGAGVSGQSARSFAVGSGMEVCLFDEGGKGDASEFDEKWLRKFDAFIFSPGFAEAHPWRALVEGASVPCYSELGFAALHWRGRIIGITGTNGKTTLTSLLSEALKSVEITAVAAGNIGIPLSDYILSEYNQKETYAVCEISSFQAELSRGLQLDGFIWTNFAEDHLDRHASMKVYFAAKRKLLGCLRPNAPAFLGTSVYSFDPSVGDARNTFVVEEDSELIQRLAPESPFRMRPQSANFALAVALWNHFGFPTGALIDCANSFNLAIHRLSPVVEWEGVTFWNDSKATNFHAALAAMDAMEGPIYWIGGGSYKGGDIGAFAREVASKVESAFLYGAVSKEMAGHFHETRCRFEQHVEFSKAVHAATSAALADAPSIVLLSPGFASFDQFSGYTARGDAFITTILNLKDNYCPD